MFDGPYSAADALIYGDYNDKPLAYFDAIAR